MSNRGRVLIGMLRAIGLLDMVAVLAVVSPRAWIGRIHLSLGMGALPAEPIVGYLARCTSIWYVTYGLLLWVISFDIERYAFLITCVAVTMFVQGLIMVGIDLAEGMPWWWVALEGPCCSGLGAMLLILNRSAAKQSDVEQTAH